MNIHLLDVGRNKYGDCLLITHESRRILIDGAHISDFELISRQLSQLLDQEPPFEVDLLIVTHCHSDHIGCLPALIKKGVLSARTALVADEKLGWGRDAQGNGPTDGLELTSPQGALFAALLEEDRSDLPDDELIRFIQDAATLESQYIEMLSILQDQGTHLIRYVKHNAPELRQLENDFQDFGLQLLGPSTDHLLVCAEAIATLASPVSDSIVNAIAPDADAGQLLAAYRQLCRRIGQDARQNELGASDRPGVGAAKNNQSIVLKVESGGWNALLAGDMQFAKPEVPELGNRMRALRKKIKANGPYDFIKLTHHTSYNAVDPVLLDEWESTPLFAHTGGQNDATHPEEEVLQLLERRKDRLTFARTDHNGLITVGLEGQELTMTTRRGRLNDFEPNRIPDEPAAPAVSLPAFPSAPAELSVPVPALPTTPSNSEFVEVTVRIPHATTQVSLTIHIEPEKKKNEVSIFPSDPVSSTVSELKIAAGRALPPLLLVTSWARLARNIGESETRRVAEAVRLLPYFEVIDLPTSVTLATDAAGLVRTRLNRPELRGIVLLGGYDVVPSQVLDVLDRPLRQILEAKGLDGVDADDFYVWSDHLYGDRDGDGMEDVPISRIPDGRRADVLLAALQAPGFQAGLQFGIRNLARPFAAQIFPRLPGQRVPIEVSELFGSADVRTGVATGAVYFMLHGSDQDGTRFWGETRGSSLFEAINIANIPPTARGSVIFTGCCWGALTIAPKASRVRPDTQLRPRGPEASIAMAYLSAGATAFVGCTGSHYSPLEQPFNYFGGPLHDAFWTAISAGSAPAEALLLAKRAYRRDLPHGRTDPFSRAVESKILRQFTCLGLGW